MEAGLAVTAATAGTPERGYVEVVRRRWPAVLLVIGLGVVGAALVGDVGGSEFAAETRVAVRPIVRDPFQANIRPSDSVDIDTELEQVVSTATVRAAGERLGRSDVDPPEVVRNLEVDVVGSSLVVRIQYTAARAAAARDWADAIAEAYLEQREARAVGMVSEMLRVVEAELASVEGELAALADESSDDGGVAGEIEQVLADRIRDLSAERAALLQVSTDPGEVIRPAVLPREGTGVPPWVTRVGVLGLAILGAIGLAVALDRSDRRLRSVDELATVAGPVLGVLAVPGSPAARRWDSDPADMASLARLRLGRTLGRDVRRLAVASPHDEPAVDLVASHLAYDFAADGSPTLLVATFDGLVDQGDRPTLPQLAFGEVSLDDALVAPGHDGGPWRLLIGEGDWDEVPAVDLSSLLGSLSDRFDSWVFAVPPLLEPHALGLVVAARADASVLVVDGRSAAVGDITGAITALGEVGAHYGGTVVRESRA